MNSQQPGTRCRKGRFLWMDPVSRNCYLQTLNKKIAAGVFFSDRVLSRIVDEIAPIMEEVTGKKQLRL